MVRRSDRLDPAPAPRGDGTLEERRSDGEALCRRVYGPAYDRLREHVAGLHPDLDRWMVEEGYGKTLSRPGVTVVVRELCVVALLAAAGHAPQLRSHLRGALNVGAHAEHVARALEIGLQEARVAAGGTSDAAALRRVWEAIRERVEGA